MMRHHDFKLVTSSAAQSAAYPFNLFQRDPPTLPSERTRGVQPEQHNLRIFVTRINLRRDDLSVTAQRRKKSPKDIEERHIMISGHDNRRLGQLIEKFFRRAKLCAASPLPQVAAVRD